MNQWLDEVKFDDKGLIPAIAQDAESGRILMVAWMNREALSATVQHQIVHYWSRSRQKLWQKGEESGNTQQLVELQMDCDSDVLVLKVKQEGGVACHTGRQSCFFRTLKNGVWETMEPVIRDPAEMYQKS
ncbi:MAG: phosphoribosyl-AMP cyclohydrolase [OM182 bacterium MED-G24]|uniref:Phosphoribosyl-AMP cyclohydrolase n=1 Tax=OM182 bacterium MED-G24 TaxID=1986255 RepID=A0A2A5WT29_9GAMM|nr:MAG: phosphoribosyl-AMP cyclohydrolase [OM182 bacterium MED-G24]|tara:strand:- start:234 stop:623 length:390 start_codon:yes stop_codon:yes gene_type:complete